MKRTTPTPRRHLRSIATVTLAALTIAACSGSNGSTLETTGNVAPRITVTAVKDDVRSELIAAIYARVLQDAGYRVSRKDSVELDRAGYLAALQAGEFSLIPDFSRELLAHLLDQPGAPVSTVDPASTTTAGPASTQAPVTDPTAGSGTAASTTVAPITNGRSVPEQLVAITGAVPDGVAVGQPLRAEDKVVIACTAEVMKANENQQFYAYTNLASAAPTIRLAGPAEWMADADEGYPAFQQFYGGEFDEVLTVEHADVEQAIEDDRADCFALDSLDGVITREQLTILDDDKAMVRGNAGLPLLAAEVATDDLVQVLTQVNNALTTATLNQLMNAVTTNGTDPRTVADAFLDTQGDLGSSTSLAG